MPQKKIHHLNVDQELRLLEAEYKRLSSEISMFIQQYSPRFTIFGTFVLSALAFALNNPEFELVYPIIPPFVLIIGFVSSAQAYMIACEAARIRQIERKVAELNNGNFILAWDHIANNLINSVRIRVYDRGSQQVKEKFLNPIAVSIGLMVLAVLPLYGYCLYQSWFVISGPWNIIYFVFFTYMFVFAGHQAFKFFRLDELFDSANLDIGSK